jgi:hypothetical protein
MCRNGLAVVCFGVGVLHRLVERGPVVLAGGNNSCSDLA